MCKGSKRPGKSTVPSGNNGSVSLMARHYPTGTNFPALTANDRIHWPGARLWTVGTWSRRLPLTTGRSLSRQGLAGQRPPLARNGNLLAERQAGEHLTEQRPELERVPAAPAAHDHRALAVDH